MRTGVVGHVYQAVSVGRAAAEQLGHARHRHPAAVHHTIEIHQQKHQPMVGQ
jgi:hypothetical protein